MTALTTTAKGITEKASFSFYVSNADATAIQRCSTYADAVTVRGPHGPQTVTALRSAGWTGSVLFDRAGYEKGSPEVEAEAWLADQVTAGADRALTPGRWIPWTGDPETLKHHMLDEVAVAARHNATALFALDYRWLTRGVEETQREFERAGVPLAIALSHRDDPLSAGRAVDGLISLCLSTEHLTVLRADHGAIGAVAFNARHGSLGLRTSTRHLYPPTASGGGGRRSDLSPRVFIPQLLDWFTGMTIAGWGLAELEPRCDLECCHGQPLRRFFDPRLKEEAAHHNELALSEFASHVINAPRNERRRVFAERCQQAVQTYDKLGAFSLRPKPQLESWALWA